MISDNDLYFRSPELWAAINHHTTHRKERITFKNYGYMRDIYLDTAQNRVIMKGTQCFVPGTYITTDCGIKEIQYINVGDNVLTHKGRFRKVTKAYKREYAGNLVSITPYNNSELLCTPEHPIYTTRYERKKYHNKRYSEVFTKNPEWVRAIDANVGWFVYSPKCRIKTTKRIIDNRNYVKNVKEDTGEYIRSHKSRSFLKGKLRLTKSLGELFGYYIAEGYARGKKTEVGFCFHRDETQYANKVKREIALITKNCKIYEEVREEDKSRKIIIRNRMLHDVFSQLCGAGCANKKIPEYAYKNKEFAKGLIVGMVNGDGCVSERGVSYKTVSPRLAYGLKILLSQMGIESAATREGQKNKQDAYTVTIKSVHEWKIRKILNASCVEKRRYGFFAETEYGYANRIRKIDKKEYSGAVYNLTVDEDNTYIANNIIVHNCGMSEFLIILALMRAESGRSVFYVLPTYQLQNRFVKNRFHKSVMYTPYYQDLVKGEEVKKLGHESATLKQIKGGGVIAFVSSRSEAAFTEFPADDVIIDELDKCDQKNIIMADERLSNSKNPKKMIVSNPTIPDFGIDEHWKRSDRKEWYIKCSECGKWVYPDFFEVVVREVATKTYIVRDPDYDRMSDKDIRMICPHCNKPMDRFNHGAWVRGAESRISGRRVTKLFSTKLPLRDTVDRFNVGLGDDDVLQRFYNADLGLPFVSKGAKINRDDILNNREPYLMDRVETFGATVVGIDVGNVFNIIIADILPDMRMRTLYIGTCREEAEVVEILKQYRTKMLVIDANPERRVARAIINQVPGFMAFYADVKGDSVSLEQRTVTVDRTATIDDLKRSIVTGRIVYPDNVENIPEFIDQMTAAVRIYDEDMNRGAGGYKWTEGSKADHYMHASVYMLLAYRMLVYSANAENDSNY